MALWVIMVLQALSLYCLSTTNIKKNSTATTSSRVLQEQTKEDNGGLFQAISSLCSSDCHMIDQEKFKLDSQLCLSGYTFKYFFKNICCHIVNLGHMIKKINFSIYSIIQIVLRWNAF